MKKLALVVAALVAGFVSMACNTVRVSARTSKKGGEAIQRAVK